MSKGYPAGTKRGTFNLTPGKCVPFILESFVQQNEGIQKLAEWKTKNDRLTKDACEKLVKKLKREHLDPVLDRVRGPKGTSVSYKEIDDGCAIIELEYKTHAVGAKNVRAQVLHEFHEVSVKTL